MQPSVGVLPVALLLTACGSGRTVSLDPVAAAAEKSASRGSTKVRVALEGGFKASGTGTYDNAEEGFGRSRIDISTLGRKLHFDVVSRGLLVYLRSPVLAPGLPSGKKWAKVDLEHAPSRSTHDLDSFVSADPHSLFGYLGGAVGKPRRLGAESVRGSETTRFRQTISLEKATKVASPTERPFFATLVRNTADAGPHTFSIDVWVDSEGLVRKAHYIRFLPGLDPLEVTLDVLGYDDPLDIAPPPAAEVADLTKAAGSEN